MTKRVYTALILEDEGIPVNNAGGGNIAGIGVGPQGEPGVTPRKKKKLAVVLRRGTNNVH